MRADLKHETPQHPKAHAVHGVAFKLTNNPPSHRLTHVKRKHRHVPGRLRLGVQQSGGRSPT